MRPFWKWVFGIGGVGPEHGILSSPKQTRDPYQTVGEVMSSITLQIIPAMGGQIVMVHAVNNGMNANYVPPRAVLVPDGADMIATLATILVQEKLTK